jgi:hypothetical protein
VTQAQVPGEYSLPDAWRKTQFSTLEISVAELQIVHRGDQRRKLLALVWTVSLYLRHKGIVSPTRGSPQTREFLSLELCVHPRKARNNDRTPFHGIADYSVNAIHHQNSTTLFKRLPREHPKKLFAPELRPIP